MSEDQINQAIAEACPNRFKFFAGFGWHYGPDNSDWIRCVDGSICADLNAMHEAEKMLTDGQLESYVWWLNHLHPSADIHYPDDTRGLRKECFALIHATARQRAEAFLRTVGKWRE